MKIVYIAGPYIGDGTYVSIRNNIIKAEDYAIVLSNNNVGFFCPHLNSKLFNFKTNASEDFFISLGLEMLKKCDLLMVIPGWKSSKGTINEIEYAKENNIPVYYINNINNIHDMIYNYNLNDV